jgi:hypothetical protein
MKRYTLVIVSAVLAAASVPPSLAHDGPSVVYSQNSEANASFLRARDYLGRSDPRVGGKLENAREAIKLYEQAVNEDPKFALANVGMARA